MKNRLGKLTPSLLLICTAAGVLAGASTSYAEPNVLLEDNFDSYATQAEFEAMWPVAGNLTTTGILGSARSLSSPNSVTYGTTAMRNDRLFTETGTPLEEFNVIRFSIDFYDSNAAAFPYREVASLIDGPGTSSGQLISLGMNNTLAPAADGGNFYMARILGVDGGTGSGAFFKLNLGGPATLRSTGWHNLAVEITDKNFTFYVDGILAENVPNATTPRSYDSVRLGSGLTSVNDASLDNVQVILNPLPIPEPSTLALLGLGALGMIHRKRR